MGLTNNSTGNNILNDNLLELKEKCDYVVGLSGNPNVRKKQYI